ncbi:MAG: hypothetical protein ACRCXZ_05930 [Patescibacteria group bacterium]
MNINNKYFIIGAILAGVFLPTIIGDTNNRLINIPGFLGLVLIGYSLSNKRL